MADVKNGIHTGCCDNLSGVLAVAQLIQNDDICIEFTNGEETNLEGAKWVANHYSASEWFIIVVDTTDRSTHWKNIQFTVENPGHVDIKHIKRALRPFYGKYKLREFGVESEAWLYKREGFSCVEIDVPVALGLHNLHNKAKVSDIIICSEAMKVIADYMKEKTREQILPVEHTEERR
jgi:putative aminopeptidase FrvX